MRQLIAGGVVGLTSLFVLKSDNNNYLAQTTAEQPKIIDVPTTETLIKSTDLYWKVEKIEKELNENPERPSNQPDKQEI